LALFVIWFWLIIQWAASVINCKYINDQQLPTLLFADDKVTIADTEDNLQKAVQKLNQIITEYGLNISVQKTKWMA